MRLVPARLQALRLSAEERRIERAVRAFKRELRVDAENSPERRAAALEAEDWRARGSGYGFAQRR